MFEDSSEKPTPQTKKRHNETLIYILAGLTIFLVSLAIFLGYKVLGTPGYTIPEHIIKQTDYSIFVPKKLPSDYKIADSSFTVSEKTLIFRAEDPSGSAIVFTEQKRPDGFDFDKFYREQMIEAKRLDGTPYPSFIGKSPTDGAWLLSMVTDDTWVLASTKALLNEQDFTTIAKSVEAY